MATPVPGKLSPPASRTVESRLLLFAGTVRGRLLEPPQEANTLVILLLTLCEGTLSPICSLPCSDPPVSRIPLPSEVLRVGQWEAPTGDWRRAGEGGSLPVPCHGSQLLPTDEALSSTLLPPLALQTQGDTCFLPHSGRGDPAPRSALAVSHPLAAGPLLATVSTCPTDWVPQSLSPSF